MILYYRPIKVWPEGWSREDNPECTRSPFSSAWSVTMDELDREVAFLGAEEATLQVDTAAANCRADGGLRGDARVNYRGVILVVDSADYGTLTYPCNKFTTGGEREAWRENTRAIVLGLESLRRVERYGIADRGQQYAGYAQLGTGIALGASDAMTVDQAAAFVAEYSIESPISGRGVFTAEEILASPTKLRSALRLASRYLHPDTGGDDEKFRRLREAQVLLEGRP